MPSGSGALHKLSAIIWCELLLCNVRQFDDNSNCSGYLLYVEEAEGNHALLHSAMERMALAFLKHLAETQDVVSAHQFRQRVGRVSDSRLTTSLTDDGNQSNGVFSAL